MVKKSTLLSLSVTTLLLISTLQAQVTYVDASASGLNDGSSWENAFTLLDDALDKFNGTTIVTEEEIWVAGGTYKPGRDMADTSSTFFINAPIDLFGGFNGTETDRDQRDATTNQVILSGDIMDNDAGAMDSLNRIDNVRHVVFVDGSIPKRITFDGFTITGGQTSENGDDELSNRAGGGIISFSAMIINDCKFNNNFGRSGASIAFENIGETISDPVILSNCSFDANMSTSQSAGPVFYEVDDIEVKTCSFTNNTTNRGCCYPVDCINVLIEDCLFENNDNPSGTGGAMFVWQTSNLRLINNKYIGNSAQSAGGVYIDSRELVNETLSLTISDCEFNNNECTRFGGGLSLNEVKNVTLSNNEFIDNKAASAGGIYIDSRDVVNFDMAVDIKDCKFSNNEAIDSSGFGGGLYLFQGKNIVLDNNEFRLNSANNAGGFYYSGSQSPQSNIDNLKIKNCQFATNQALDGAGGGVRLFRGSAELVNCTFLGNVAAGSSSGGAMFANGDNKIIEVNDCLFGTNNSNWGAGVAIYGDTTNALIKNTTFLSNSADARGGGVYGGFKAAVSVDSCLFRGNLAPRGGAMSSQNDTTTLIITNSEFLSNTSTGSGGAISTVDGGYTSIFNCLFKENQGNTGGAIAFNADSNPNIDTARFLLRNSVILANTAEEQGGAINIEDIKGRIENCLIHENRAEDEGRGGAISHNVSDSMELSIVLDIVNSTIVNNLGLLSSGIAAFTDLEGVGIINMQNTLMFNLKDYQVEAGTPIFNSLGGNYSRDVANMTQYFNDDDILQSNPSFVDQANMNYRLMSDSPCIDAGIAGNAPERDIQGYIRDANPDIGCFEFVLNTSIGDIETTTFNVWPNPTSEYINLDLYNQEKLGSIYIYNSQGQVVKKVRSDARNISVADLNNGLYFILINGQKKYQATFVKE